MCIKHEDPTIDKGFCIEELAEMYECVDNNDCSDGSVSSTYIFALLDDDERNAKYEKTC